MNWKRVLTSLFIAGIVAVGCKSQKRILHNGFLRPSLDMSFVHPPDSIQTSIYWYWMSDNISKEGVVKDLHAMKSIGINRAFIGNIGYSSTPYGKVKLFSDEWWDILHTALKTATELNIEIGIFNSPGWSQSGGPWIKPEQSMRYLTSSEMAVKGGRHIRVQLPRPSAQFQDVKVIAFKTPQQYGQQLSDLKPELLSSIPVDNLQLIMDGNHLSEVAFPADKVFTIDIVNRQEFTVRSLLIYPAHHEASARASLQIKTDAGYETIKEFTIDRGNSNLNVGFDPYGPVAVSIPATKSTHFRLRFSNPTGKFGLAEIELSASPRVERFTEKTLAKMYQTPLPYWKEYQWPIQPEVEDKALLIDPLTVKDISNRLSADGLLNWDAPAGNWTIMRMGMVPTQVKNAPASPEGTGLEVDKMSKTHVESHFNAFLGEIMRRIPAADRKTWKLAVEDSYETGGQNWTDDLIKKFQGTFGYDPLPYLPVIKGKVVGSQAMSDRFLWDLRRLIADRVAYDYVGGLRGISNKNGLHIWLENYGHWGFPGEFLQYGGQSDEIGGEFWSEGELGNIENRAASSAAHIYGKNKVSAESFTAGGKAYARYPALMKQRGDRFFTEGINNTLLHVFIEQPDDKLMPGINADFGIEFNRHNTWFSYMDMFTSYLKRSNLMLQQGRYVADVAYFIGEDAPKMTGITDPAMPAGYAFDYINGEVIKNRLQVKENKLVLPDGMSYSILVLPKLETMRPELLLKIESLVKAGATILGPAPLRSPSLQGYPVADAKVKAIAERLWGIPGVSGAQVRQYGKGKILTGMDMQEALNFLNIKPDFDGQQSDSLLYIHRRTADEEIYFVSNQSSSNISVAPHFRVEGKKPELWDPITGNIRQLPQYTDNGSTATVPLKLAPLESAFVVFRNTKQPVAKGKINFPEAVKITEIASSWTVQFDPKMRGPEQPVVFDKLTDWTLRPEENIKYYSGTAVYRNNFNVAKPAASERIFLDLGDVKVMAKVKINGKLVGGVWTAPWRLDITDALKVGKNTLEISVVNTWVNRLIGDSKLPAGKRKTWTSVNPYRPESKLERSGLKGPVSIYSIRY
jgi:hypothetical protein